MKELLQTTWTQRDCNWKKRQFPFFIYEFHFIPRINPWNLKTKRNHDLLLIKLFYQRIPKKIESNRIERFSASAVIQTMSIWNCLLDACRVNIRSGSNFRMFVEEMGDSAFSNYMRLSYHENKFNDYRYRITDKNNLMRQSEIVQGNLKTVLLCSMWIFTL